MKTETFDEQIGWGDELELEFDLDGMEVDNDTPDEEAVFIYAMPVNHKIAKQGQS